MCPFEVVHPEVWFFEEDHNSRLRDGRVVEIRGNKAISSQGGAGTSMFSLKNTLIAGKASSRRELQHIATAHTATPF